MCNKNHKIFQHRNKKLHRNQNTDVNEKTTCSLNADLQGLYHNVGQCESNTKEVSTEIFSLKRNQPVVYVKFCIFSTVNMFTKFIKVIFTHHVSVLLKRNFVATCIP